MKKKFLIASLLLNVVLLVTIIILFANFSSWTNQNINEKMLKHQERRITMFETLANKPEEIVFLGASLVEGGNWSELFNNPKIVNRGISGNKSGDVLKRLDEVLAAKPEKIFTLFGYNDFAAKISTNTVLENYKKIIQQIKEKSPRTKVYIQSLTPVLYKLNGNKVKNEDLMIFNSKLKELAEARKLTFIDLFNPLIGNKNNNEIEETFTNDGLHFTAAGYTRWKALIEQFVNE